MIKGRHWKQMGGRWHGDIIIDTNQWGIGVHGGASGHFSIQLLCFYASLWKDMEFE